ncbi:MAG: aspartate kinase [Gammaproteobacteria bacterium]|nr:aspartate kinase [Gammaproteobacteria bacterium]
MSLLVHKYGGTSVGSIERIEAVADRVAGTLAAGHQIVVVVSAMSGETNRLTSLAHEITERPSSREMDVLLASGEQVSIALLAMALQKRGIDSQSFLGDQIPFKTDSSHERARIEFVAPNKLLEVVGRGAVPVVAGFQGVDDVGDVTTIGRGGSDTSAVAIAHAVDAAECLIYTDVAGVYTADPRIVDKAARLAYVDFEEMLEMASLGAKVLHTRAVEYAHKNNVPMRVLSSFEDGEGTLVTSEMEHMEKPLVSAVTHERDEAKLTLLRVNDVPGIAWKILGPIGDADIMVDMIVQNVSVEGHTDFSFTVKRADYLRAKDLLEQSVRDNGFNECTVTGDDSIAKVTIVGVGMRSHAGVATTMFETLANENINIQMISTSEIKISVVIDERYVELAVRSLHDAFELDT